MSIPTGPFPPPDNGNSSNNSSNNSSKLSLTYIIAGCEVSEETKERLNLKTDEEVAKLSEDKLRKAFLEKQYENIKLHEKNEKQSLEFEDLVNKSNVALAHSTGTNVLANMVTMQTATNNAAAITTGTKILTGGRVISIICSVAVFIITLVCILL